VSNQVFLFRDDCNGFPRFAHGFPLTPEEAKALLSEEGFGDCYAASYGAYKARQDPDTMPERELRARLGLSQRRSNLVALTGKIPGHTRKSAEAAIRQAGFCVAKSVHAGVVALWAGEGGGRKRRDAEGRGIPVIISLAELSHGGEAESFARG
jgi:NAD-dependent DNA ligase